jgi:hypothetical protein
VSHQSVTVSQCHSVTCHGCHCFPLAVEIPWLVAVLREGADSSVDVEREPDLRQQGAGGVGSLQEQGNRDSAENNFFFAGK